MRVSTKVSLASWLEKKEKKGKKRKTLLLLSDNRITASGAVF